MLASELIQALTELIKKHGDVTVYADDEEHGPYEVDFAGYVDWPSQEVWGSANETEEIKGVLLQDKWTTPNSIVIPLVEVEGNGELDFVSIEQDGFTLSFTDEIDG
jgi:hypothetical protein